MPHLAEKTLSQFIRTRCKRQLRLNMTPNTAAFERERAAAGMAPKQPAAGGGMFGTPNGEARLYLMKAIDPVRHGV